MIKDITDAIIEKPNCCNDSEVLWNKSKTAGCDIFPEGLLIYSIKNNETIDSRYMTFNYCPFCGTEIKKDKL